MKPLHDARGFYQALQAAMGSIGKQMGSRVNRQEGGARAAGAPCWLEIFFCGGESLSPGTQKEPAVKLALLSPKGSDWECLPSN